MQKKITTYYEATMGVLALAAVSLAVLDLTSGLNSWQHVADNVILVIFIIDYFVRFVLAGSKMEFLKKNIFDLIAIIPFSSFFRAFRIARLTRVLKIAKISKISRLAAYSLRFAKKARVFLDTNGFKYMLGLCCALIASGGVAIHYAEGTSLEDGLWWAFVTSTTVGYGDISPSTNLGRIVAIILMITGIGLIGMLTSTITSFFFNVKKEEEIKHKNKLIGAIKEQIDELETMSNEDIDRICEILKTFKK